MNMNKTYLIIVLRHFLQKKLVFITFAGYTIQGGNL